MVVAVLIHGGMWFGPRLTISETSCCYLYNADGKARSMEMTVDCRSNEALAVEGQACKS
jgi:hypothetical protein